MKTSKSRLLITVGIMAASLFLSVDSFSQTRKLPDGTIIYPDGTRKLPNGTVIYKDGGSVSNGGTSVSLPDGSVLLPDGTRTYPNDRNYPNERRRYNKRAGKGLPPGQAKKIYGGSAKDYAPGQQKKWNKQNKGWKKNKH